MPPITTFQGLLELLDNNSQQTMIFYGTQGVAKWGGQGSFGSLSLADGNGANRLRLMTHGLIGLDGAGVETVQLSTTYSWLKLLSGGKATVDLRAGQAKLTMGDHGKTGEIYLKGDDGKTRVRVNGYEGKLHLNDASGASKATIGPEGSKVKHWTLRLRDENGNNLAVLGKNGNLTLGGGGRDREMGHDGDITVRDRQGRDRIRVDGDKGQIRLTNAKGTERVRLDGESGDILMFNADCAEEFETDDDGTEPGSVMVARQGSRVARADRAYDRRVVGVVSGAGGFRPAIVLGHRKSSHRRVPVAVLGRVECMADASYGAVEVGDLLTTSETSGHAMRVTDYSAAMGAVVGKALSPLPEGRGLVETLVTLR